MKPIFVTFRTQIENPQYSPYSSANKPQLEYVGTGTLVHIDLSHFKSAIVVDLNTGNILSMPLEDIKVPVENGKLIEQKDAV